MKRDHPLSKAVLRVAAKLEPGPYTIIEVRYSMIFDMGTASGKQLTRIHLKDLKPFA